MENDQEVNELYERYKKEKTPVVIDAFSYQDFIKGKSKTLLHKLDDGKWVEAVPPIPKEDIINAKFRGYSHGYSPKSIKKLYSEEVKSEN